MTPTDTSQLDITKTNIAVQELIEATEKGDYLSVHLAVRLTEKYPEAALPALLAGARAARETQVRARLVGWVGQLDNPEAMTFLLEEVR